MKRHGLQLAAAIFVLWAIVALAVMGRAKGWW